MTIVPTTLGILAGVGLMTGIYHIIVALKGVEKKTHLTFSLAVLIVPVYTLAAIKLYTAQDVESFLQGIRIQMFCFPYFFVLYCWFVTLYSGIKTRPFLTILTIIYAPIPFIRLLFPTTLVYKNIEGIRTIMLPWGERISNIDASISVFGYFYYLLFLPVFSHILWAAFQMILRGEKSKGYFLAICQCLILAAGINDICVDTCNWNWMYLAEFSLVSMVVLMSFKLSVELFKAVITKTRLLETEEKYHEIFNTTSEAVFIHDAQTGAILEVNNTFESMFGYTISEAYAMNITDISSGKHPYTQEEAVTFVKKAVLEGPQLIEWHAKRKNGELFWVEVTLHSSTISGEGRVLAVVRDISKRKQAEDEKNRLISILESTSDLVSTSTIDKKITYMNKAGRRMVGWGDEEDILESEIATVHPPWAEEIIMHEGIPAALRHGIWEGETALINTEGTEVPTSQVIMAHQMPDGETGYLSTIIRDISEQKQAEEEMEKLAIVVKHSSELVNLATLEGKMIFLNQAGSKMLGIDPEEVDNVNIMEVIPDHLKNLVEKELLPALISGGIWEGDIQYRNLKTGELTDVHAMTFTVKQSGTDKPLYLANVSLDITESKKANEALRESEEKYRNIINSSPMGMHMYQLEEDGRLIFTGANIAADKLLGLDNSQFIGKSIEEAFPPLAETEVPKRYREVASKGKSWYTEQINYEDQRIEGAFEVHAFQTSPNKMVVMFVEITERKKAEEALCESEEKYRSLFESSPDAITTTDLTGTVTDCNDGAVRLHNYSSKDELIGVNALDFIAPEDHQKAQENLQKTLTTGQSGHIEYTLLKKDGRAFPGELSAGIIKDASGDPSSFVAIVKDISERKENEIRLQMSEERFRQLAENIEEIFFLIEKGKDSVLYISPMCETILGIPHAHFYEQQKHLFDRIHPEDIKNVGFVDERRRFTETHNEEFRIKRPDGAVRWLRLRSFPVYDNQGNQYRCAGVVTDISEYKNAQESANIRQQQLIQADKLASLGLMVSGVAHEINNPNNLIMMNSGVLKSLWEKIRQKLEENILDPNTVEIMDMPAQEVYSELERMLTGITSGSGRIQTIVQDLKNFARTEHGHMTDGVSIEEVITGACNIMGNLIKKSTNNFTVSHDNNVPPIHANFQKLEQVIINLVTNSCQALGSQNDTIAIKSSYNPGLETVQIRIFDTGAGISKKNLSKIMDPFFTTKHDEGGTGLGLSVSYGIINEHGGTINAQSRKGKCTTFDIQLPVKGPTA